MGTSSAAAPLDSSFGAVPRGAPACGELAPPIGRGPSCIRSAMISVVFLWTPCLSAQLLVRSRPSMRATLPFVRYWLATSACLPQRTTLWNSASSCCAPALSRHVRLVARLNVHTAAPEGVVRSWGSAVSRPMMKTLFKFMGLVSRFGRYVSSVIARSLRSSVQWLHCSRALISARAGPGSPVARASWVFWPLLPRRSSLLESR
jgi:hypothetical protein